MSKPKILIIDDQRYFLLITKEMVEDAGYQAIITNDVEEGVRFFYEKKPDAVVLDVVMPKEFGTEVCRDLKSTEQGENTPIILISSGVKEMAQAGSLKEYKADDYILKPLNKDFLIGILNKHLAGKGAAAKVGRKEEVLDLKEAIMEEEAAPVSEKGAEKVAEPPKPKPPPLRVTKGAVDESVKIEQGEGTLIVTIGVGSKTRDIFLGNSMVNVKNGGIFLVCDYPAALGSKTQLKFICPGEEIQLRGMVVWIQPANVKTKQPAGMGIRFHDQKAEGLEKLKNYVFSLRS